MQLELLTADEVADFMRLSLETVRRLAAAGKLPGTKVGRGWRFPKDEIEALVRRHQCSVSEQSDNTQLLQDNT